MLLCAPDSQNKFTAVMLGDCVEGSAGTNPGAVDVCGNELDEDCSGADLVCPFVCTADAQCAAGEICDEQSGECICMPGCAGKQCGFDNCGNVCGTCAADEACDADGQCICMPNCTGKQCGDDGCGGTCGACDDANTCTTDACTSAGQCQYTAIAAGTCCGLEPVVTNAATTTCEFYDATGILLRSVQNPGLGTVPGMVGECGVWCGGSTFTCAGDFGGGFSYAGTISCGWDGAHFPNTP